MHQSFSLSLYLSHLYYSSSSHCAPVRSLVALRRTSVLSFRAIREEEVDLLVLMVPPDSEDPNTPQPFVTLTTELARRAPCEVVLARTAAA